MIIVTGGVGFIGSNLVKALNDKGLTDVLVVDDLTLWDQGASDAKAFIITSRHSSKRSSASSIGI